ncbi:hypothetical protein SAMN04488028_104324 [Reichenbachiella agariperforans]|uniref:Uncharacterized protein n=1 Tax=Reichenbachiella agariperforans TaxID=156994 RepID=A0A1M6RX01_REIAG|nr:hypothetical protein SAMN04488028_104324 [Reichenbachiella agariperforans]
MQVDKVKSESKKIKQLKRIVVVQTTFIVMVLIIMIYNYWMK